MIEAHWMEDKFAEVLEAEGFCKWLFYGSGQESFIKPNIISRRMEFLIVSRMYY